MTLKIEAVPVQLFTMGVKEKRLVAFASDLPRVWMHKLYDDSIDLGMKVQGRYGEKLFTLEREEYRQDELVAWHLTDLKHGWTAIIYND